MRREAATVGASSSGVRAVGGLLLVLVLCFVVLLLVRARPAPEPFDPRSGRPDGARGLVLTLRELGADVTVDETVPAVGGSERVLVLDDRLDDEQRGALLDFVEAGGVAIVADPASALHGGSGLDGGAVAVEGDPLFDRRLPTFAESNVLPGDCTIEALVGLRGLYVPDGVLFPVGPTEPRCFEEGGTHSFVIVRTLGSGVVVGLGDNEPFTNAHLRRADNAGLLARLLVPGEGAPVSFVVGNGTSPTVEDVGSGDDTLVDLVPTWVWMLLALGALAFVVYAVSRAVRPGRVVAEPVAVPIAGSELVSARGNLMARAHHAERAGWLLAGRLHRDLSEAFGVPIDASLVDLDRAVAERTGTVPGEVAATLATTVDSDDQLLALARRLDTLRRRTLGPSGVGEAIGAGRNGNGTDAPGDPVADDDRISRGDPTGDATTTDDTTPDERASLR